LDDALASVSTVDLSTARKVLQDASSGNALLGSRTEIDNALRTLRELGLPPHLDAPKNWDALRALRTIIAKGDVNAKILDVGCGISGGVLLRWLRHLGFDDLYGCDVMFKHDFIRGGVRFLSRDLTNTRLPSSEFDFISSLSVIEHGVDFRDYFGEMYRLLKPGGFLITSTDYWPEKIDTSGIWPYGGRFGEMRVFSAKELGDLVEIADRCGLNLLEPLEYAANEAPVMWNGRRFTFAYFELRKRIPRARE
jgi:SAM-dependent methyltransferase